MSLILEALRKSEAERRRGQSPDLLTELPPAARRANAPLSPVVWMVLAVLVLAAGAWLMRARWSPGAREDGAVVIPSQADDIRPQSLPPPSVTPRAVVDAPRRSKRHPSSRAAVADAATAAPMTPSVPLPTTSARNVAEERVAAPPQTPVGEPTRSEPGSGTVAMPVPQPASTPVASASGNTLKLTDLTVDQRKQLPPLRMSMHMWDADPSRRFVIIDGARYGQGDRIGAALVEQITADSVLLNWNGLRLRLPLR